MDEYLSQTTYCLGSEALYSLFHCVIFLAFSLLLKETYSGLYCPTMEFFNVTTKSQSDKIWLVCGTIMFECPLGIPVKHRDG